MFRLSDIYALGEPSEDPAWLQGAETGVGFLEENAASEEIVIFAALPAMLVNAVLLPSAELANPPWKDMERFFPQYDGGWSIEYTTGGSQPPQVRLSPPLSDWGNPLFEKGERLVFQRRFESVETDYQTELSQPFVQALNVHFVKERHAFCRLDEHGDIQPVIRITEKSVREGRRSQVITVLSEDLHRYMAVTETTLVRYFDFTRFATGSFGGWAGQNRYERAIGDLRYHGEAQGNASYCHGVQIVRPQVTRDDVIEQFRREWNDDDKQYATFIAQDWKNNRIAEVSCAPSALASYFEPESKLPFQTTPAFFRPEVLNKYRLDPERYTLEHRSISCRGGWFLKSYDVNEAGQVHAYLCDIARLTYNEQLYWKSFNEPPKGPISKRAYRSDFLGSWDIDRDPLVQLKGQIAVLDRTPPAWWEPRGEELAKVTHYPLTQSSEEWSNALLSLDQLLVEGFRQDGLRRALTQVGHPFEQGWAPVRLLQAYLEGTGMAAEEAKAALEPLRQLHYLRSKTKGHATGTTKKGLISEAVSAHGSLKDHFRWLVDQCDRALSVIDEKLPR